jgi:hypothetical protein
MPREVKFLAIARECGNGNSAETGIEIETRNPAFGFGPPGLYLLNINQGINIHY